MSTYKRNKSGGSQSEGGSNSASPASSVALSNPSSSQGINNNAPKYGTLVPNRIFVGGITGETTEADLTELFSQFGNVKATKIISDRAGVSKGYGFITFETEEEVKFLIKDGNNVLLKERKLNIAPAIKKQPPFSRSFDANSPPPTAPSIYFHNGMPYTFHNGMAFFTPTPHQPAIAALPPSADIYPSYGPTQNTPPAPYGTPLLLPAHPPVFMPQNFSYQPMPMSNGAVPPQFIYTSSGSNSSNPGSPMAATPDTPQLPAQHFYPQQYTAHEAYFPQQYFISYNYGGDYDAQEQQNANDDCSSTVSTSHTDMSDRSSNRSPANSPFFKNVPESTVARTEAKNAHKSTAHTNTENQVPVVSWQNLKNNAEERELQIRDGRRSFYPSVPPPAPPRPEVMIYQPTPFPGNVFTHQPVQMVMSRAPRQATRPRYRDPVSNMPAIPKFPTSFNNNNPLAANMNFQDKKPADTRPQRFVNVRGRARGNVYESNPNPPPSNPKPANSYSNSSPSPQMMQGAERPIMMANPAPRWATSPIAALPLAKRVISSKRQNGCSSNLGTVNSANSSRLARKSSGGQDRDRERECEGDVGGGGDAQAMVRIPSPSDVNAKMQSLSLSS